MQSNGDINACLRKLETLLRTIKYQGHVDYNGLSKGDPSAFLPIVSFTLTSFSPPFANQLMEAGLELTGKTDLRFTDTLYKVLRDIFHYKPILTKQQFLQWGFSVRKISVICDIINLVLQKHNLLKKPRVRCPASHKEHRGEAHPNPADADTVSKKPLVENHMAEVLSPHNVTHISHNEVDSSTFPGEGELAGQGVDNDDFLYSSEVEGRLSALEAQLGSVVCVLDRLSVLETRMEELDQHRNTVKDEGQLVTLSRKSLEHLMSRLLLLETKVDLNNIQLSVPPQCPSCPCDSNDSSSSMSDASKAEEHLQSAEEH
ncbi:centrosomal protein of 44 kDa isoform X2 [Eleginops maclovinus]|uniref:centrosomal protein of 44 kDa isoform X2 n=1 Tax=Eleginops maclovinus TaxID=56733 RepID=UPI0030809C23